MLERNRVFVISVFLVLSVAGFAEDLTIKGIGVLRIESLAEGLFRVRVSPDGQFNESIMERYGIVRSTWPATKQTIEQKTQDTLRLCTEAGSLSIDKHTGEMTLYDAKGKEIVKRFRLLDKQENIKTERVRWIVDRFGAYRGQPDSEVLCLSGYVKKNTIIGQPENLNNDSGAAAASENAMNLEPFGAVFKVGASEKFYGLGAASGERIQHRGYAYRNWAEYFDMNGYDKKYARFEQTEGPCPFLMSTAGWGVFVNSPALSFFDIASYKDDEVFFWGPQGEIDFFLFVSDSMAGLIDKYTQVTGRPRLLPIWGYGLSFVGNITQDQYECLQDAQQFRQNDIPCDIYGLEPQWMKQFYDFSHQKEWDLKRFSQFDFMGKDGTMVGALERMGFTLSLWLCVDDDLTIEEERQIAKQQGTLDTFPKDAPQGWFEHLKKFVNQGVAAFKVDPSKIVETHFDRKYFNGQSDLQMHNLTQTLIHKQMQQGFEQFTHQRAMVHFCGSYAGVQQFGASTMGDNGGGPKAMVWMLGHGLNGHINTTCDMWPGSPAGIHFGFLVPWSQHNNWASCQQPWFLGEEGLRIYRKYAKLRYSLLPYIYSTAHVGCRSGMPIMRAMPLAYPNDAACENLTTQYMLGDFLLSAVYTDTLYLPEGKWIDYWTGNVYQGPVNMKIEYPKDCGGALFVKSGAILPMWPPTDHVRGKQFETILLDIYPGGDSQFTLYEDDGISLDYTKGCAATTKITCQENNSEIRIELYPRKGTYTNMPKNRNYELALHIPKPKSIHVDQTACSVGYDQDKGIAHLHADESSTDSPTTVVVSKQE